MKTEITRFLIRTGVLFLLFGFYSLPLSSDNGIEPLIPKHTKLLKGRHLFIGKDGAAYVRIDPAPMVRLTYQLVPVTFSHIESADEAMEVAEILQTGAIIESKKAFNEIVILLESYGLKRVGKEVNDVDSFLVRKGSSFEETVSGKKGNFHVTYTALVSNLKRMGQTLKVVKFDYYFRDTIGMEYCSEQILLDGIILDWQSMSGSPAVSVPMEKRHEIAQKAFRLCGKALPLGRTIKRVGRVNY